MGGGERDASLMGGWLSEEDGDPLSPQTRLLWSKVSWPWEDGWEQRGMSRDCSCPSRPIASHENSLTHLSHRGQIGALPVTVPFTPPANPIFGPTPSEILFDP